jgi:DNA-binding PadR family transcriptional regulator
MILYLEYLGMNEFRGYLDLILLAALANGPAHGYLIMQRIRERSGGLLDYPDGSIYPALHCMEEDGLISASWATVSGRKRRTYQLTRKGEAELGSETQRWRRFAGAVESVLGEPT